MNDESKIQPVEQSIAEVLLKQRHSKVINSIGLFIDGQYYYLVDQALKSQSRRINLKGLMKFIQKAIAAKYDLDSASCVVTETHFFRGRYKAKVAAEKRQLLDDRKFEDRLIENDVILHYKHVYDMPDGMPHEKGIDVWFALEAFELALYRDFDFIVMITGDADYEMLARKIKTLKKPAILLSWHYDNQDPTAKALKEEMSYQININDLLKADPTFVNYITESASV
jgi:uncharacterized LabA/DUF88 family protein